MEASVPRYNFTALCSAGLMEALSKPGGVMPDGGGLAQCMVSRRGQACSRPYTASTGIHVRSIAMDSSDDRHFVTWSEGRYALQPNGLPLTYLPPL